MRIHLESVQELPRQPRRVEPQRIEKRLRASGDQIERQRLEAQAKRSSISVPDRK